MLEYKYHPIYKYIAIMILLWIILDTNKHIPSKEIAGIVIISILIMFGIDNYIINDHEYIFEYYDYLKKLNTNTSLSDDIDNKVINNRLDNDALDIESIMENDDTNDNTNDNNDKYVIENVDVKFIQPPIVQTIKPLVQPQMQMQMPTRQIQQTLQQTQQYGQAQQYPQQYQQYVNQTPQALNNNYSQQDYNPDNY
jgi:hypothetical protein